MNQLKRTGSVTQLYCREQPFIILGGELHNSSASSVDDINSKFAHLADLNLNTILAPVSWELTEPVEGAFDFKLVDAMLTSAREHNMQLVLLWFGTMKNATSCYTPAWVKTDLQRFPRAQTTPGKSSWTVSPFGQEIRSCDARAFAAFMHHLREADGQDGTVLMVQVENEPGILGAARDLSPIAQAAFADPVPTALTEHLADRRDILAPDFAAIWERCGARRTGTWQDVFGDDAEEVFMAWHIASFVNAVAQAGKTEYDLPMFANAWLQHGPGYKPGDYPSGGPLARLIDVWHAAAPALDFLAPDIYEQDFRRNCADYHRPDNPLFVPEARNSLKAPGNALYAIGRHRALGFCPFAIDDCPANHPLGDAYALLGEMIPEVTAAQAENRITAFVQQEDEASWQGELDGIRFMPRTVQPMDPESCPGYVLLIALGNREFIAVGRNLTVTFEPVDTNVTSTELVALDAGAFRNGVWHTLRRLNGDETAHGTGLLLRDRLTCFRFTLHCFQ